LILLAVIPFIFVACSQAITPTALPGDASTSTTLLFLGNKNVPPVIYLDGTTPSGLAVDMAQALSKYISKPIEIRAMDWSEAQAMVGQGKADENAISQILDNLLSNAIKFTPPGGRIDLNINGSPVAQQVRISVSDTGIGIQQADLPRLFQPFEQLDTRLSRQYEGAGMGLALVKLLAELHGGSMEVESVFGQGSRFTVVLPWRLDESTETTS
jgi:signal transduction histidine kinase